MGVHDHCCVSSGIKLLLDILGLAKSRKAFSEFDRTFDFGEARRIGFTESVDPVEGYRIAFDRMRAAKILLWPSVWECIFINVFTNIPFSI